MSSGGFIETTINYQNHASEKLIRSKFADILVKVDGDVYHLDRLQLACKSDYFEKLFTEDFYEKKCDLIEVPVMDSETFSTILDIIYGQELESVLNVDNYVTLLMAMDYLQMNIDLKIYNNSIKNILQNRPLFDGKIFQLCEYLEQNRNFEDLAPNVFNYLSIHLEKARQYREFLSLSLEHVVGIISSQRVGFKNVDNIRDCCRICVEWIFHDVGNRLPHGIKLVNAAKRRLLFSHLINDEDFSVKMRNSGEEITLDAVLKVFYKMVICRGEIGEKNCNVVVEKQKTADKEVTSINNFDIQNERDKMTKFLKNGDFHDTAIKVEGKSYQLHRYKLHSSSGYFAHLFSTKLSEATRQPNDLEYSLNVEGVDRVTFELTIKYIYCSEISLTCDIIVGILKAANVLKIDSLLIECESWIQDNVDSISFPIVAEILNFIRQNDAIRWAFLHRFLLCKRILENWLEIDDFSPFFAISIDILEDLLVSSTFHIPVDSSSLPTDFCLNDPSRLLDICSKWVIDDVQNRYKFIPRIALAINRNYTLCCDDFKMAVPDWSNCSLQFVRDELEKMLSLTSPIPVGTSNKNSREFKQEPIFIASKCGRAISVLNAEFDEIASLFFEYSGLSFSPNKIVSATTIDDNVFIAYSINGHFFSHISFQVFNISSKKFTSLTRIQTTPHSEEFQSRYVLLNCRDNVYCCFQNGHILKYLPQLNRWMKFWEPESTQKDVFFASDGKNFYRMLRRSNDSSTFNFDMYDFHNKRWTVISGLSWSSDRNNRACEMIIINGSDIAVREATTVHINRKNERYPRRISSLSLPEMCFGWEFLSTVTQCEIGILHVRGGKLYQLGDHQRWQLVKEFRVRSFYGESIYNYCFENVAGVHRPMASIQNVEFDRF